MAQPEKLSNNINDRTFQEVEYLKKSLGPILVAALAEICIRRPADPIEYLGHWLLRWRYNEELKRRDVQNAMDVVQQRQWAQMKEETEAMLKENQPETLGEDVPDDLYARGLMPGEEEGEEDYAGMVPAVDTLLNEAPRRSSNSSKRGSKTTEPRPSQGGGSQRGSKALEMDALDPKKSFGSKGSRGSKGSIGSRKGSQPPAVPEEGRQSKRSSVDGSKKSIPGVPPPSAASETPGAIPKTSTVQEPRASVAQAPKASMSQPPKASVAPSEIPAGEPQPAASAAA